MLRNGKVLLVIGIGALVGLLLTFAEYRIPEVRDRAERTEADWRALIVSQQQERAEEQEAVALLDSFDFEVYKVQKLATLSEEERMLFEKLENDQEQSDDLSSSIQELNQLIALSEKVGFEAVAMEYSKKAATLIDQQRAWLKTADDFALTYSRELQDAGLRNYLREQAIESYEAALKYDTANAGVQLRIALLYVEGNEPTQVMRGVRLLKGIIDEDPTNTDAYLALGRNGVRSGQFKRAIERLEKVVALDPAVTETYLLLGEAYNGLGEKEKAIEYLEQFKRMVNDPNVSREVSRFIEQIKNS